MFFDKPWERINKKIKKLLLTDYSGRVRKLEDSYASGYKKTSLAILTSSCLLAGGLLLDAGIRFPKLINKNVDIIELSDFVCLLVIIDFAVRFKNNSDICIKTKSVPEEIFLKFPGSILGIDFGSDRGKRFTGWKKVFSGMGESGIDPRDMWIEQELQFYEKILPKNFNLRSYYANDKIQLFLLSKASQETRIQTMKLFDEFCEKYPLV